MESGFLLLASCWSKDVTLMKETLTATNFVILFKDAGSYFTTMHIMV